MVQETPCVVEVDGRRQRGLVRMVEEDFAYVQSVDHGPIRRVPMSGLRCLPARFADPPQVRGGGLTCHMVKVLKDENDVCHAQTNLDGEGLKWLK